MSKLQALGQKRLWGRIGDPSIFNMDVFPGRQRKLQDKMTA